MRGNIQNILWKWRYIDGLCHWAAIFHLLAISVVLHNCIIVILFLVKPDFIILLQEFIERTIHSWFHLRLALFFAVKASVSCVTVKKRKFQATKRCQPITIITPRTSFNLPLEH